MITWKWNIDEAKEVWAEEAREDGEKMGIAKKPLSVIQNMLQLKLPYETISKSTETPIDEVMRIAREQNMVY